VTWIIGAASLFGYGAVISDVEVTLRTGERRRALQKAFHLGNSLVGGFAGSVLIGFRLLENLRANLELPVEQRATHAWDPRFVANEWSPIARRIFDNASQSERKLGSQFLLVGVSPSEDRGVANAPIVYLIRFVSPEFKPGFIRRTQVMCSIGSGTAVRPYIQELRPQLDIHSSLNMMEMAGQGGWAHALSYSMSRMIRAYPTAGISPNLHTLVVGHGIRSVANNDEKIIYADGSKLEMKMPLVAKTYAEFEKLIRSEGDDAAAAMC
jgi:hypothetical protein